MTKAQESFIALLYFFLFLSVIATVMYRCVYTPYNPNTPHPTKEIVEARSLLSEVIQRTGDRQVRVSGTTQFFPNGLLGKKGDECIIKHSSLTSTSFLVDYGCNGQVDHAKEVRGASRRVEKYYQRGSPLSEANEEYWQAKYLQYLRGL